MSYDTSTRTRILQRWIEATIYNDESSKSGSCVTDHNTVLHNLGYKCEPKVFIKIQRNQYNPYHVNRCVEFQHGKELNRMSDNEWNWQLKQSSSPMMIVNPKVPSSKLQVFVFRICCGETVSGWSVNSRIRLSYWMINKNNILDDDITMGSWP